MSTMSVKNKIMSYLLDRKLVSRQQHGFLSRHSTCTQLLECVNEWSIALNNRNSADVSYFDFSRAFDSVVHSKLLCKLVSYGIRDDLLTWLRLFYVVDNNVLWSTILGPLFVKFLVAFRKGQSLALYFFCYTWTMWWTFLISMLHVSFMQTIWNCTQLLKIPTLQTRLMLHMKS